MDVKLYVRSIFSYNYNRYDKNKNFQLIQKNYSETNIIDIYINYILI